MKKKFLFIAMFSIVWVSYGQKTYEYPVAPKDSVVDTYFGVDVTDNYRYLENPIDPRTIEWLDTQEKVTTKYSRQLTSLLDIRNWMYQLYDTDFKPFEDDEDKTEEKKYEFKRKFRNLDAPLDLYYKEKSGYFKPLVKAKDHKRNKDDNIFITDWTVDDDYKYVAVEIMHSGSDWRETFIYDLATGNQLNDTIKYSMSINVVWKGEGFYYLRYDKPEKGKELLNIRKGQRLSFHKVNTYQDQDVVVFENPDRENKVGMNYYMVDSLNMLLNYPIMVRGSWYDAKAIVDLSKKDGFEPRNFLITPLDDDVFYDVEEIFGDSIIMRSNQGSPSHRILVCDKSKLNTVFELVPEYKDNLVSVNRLGRDKLAGHYQLNGKTTILVFNLKGEVLKSFSFPEGKSISGFRAKKNEKFCYYWERSFYHPAIKYKVDLETLESKPVGTLSIPYEFDKIMTKYVKYKSKDGTEVPMYLTYAKNIKLDGSNPVLLTGYGGYGHTITPDYSKEFIIWLINGGILAIPNVRGGGAEGADWAFDGRGLKKQNAIDDFVYAAKFLHDNKYSSPGKTAITGGSHGGMLVGAASIQYPELFKVAIPRAGAFDMLRLEKFTAGGYLTNHYEFGTTADSLECMNLLSYSPLHNIKKGVKYPSILVMTGDTDDRVPPLHSYKFVAALQENGDSSSPYLLHVQQGTGHSGALTYEEFFDDISFRYNFIFKELGVKLKDRIH